MGNDNNVVKIERRFFEVHHAQAAMFFIANFLVAAVRFNMGLAIVAMTDKTKDDTFDWNLSTQSIIQSSMQWGYIVSLMPSGEIASRHGGYVLLLTSIGLNGISSSLLPTAAFYGGWQAVVAVRVVQGFAQGMHYPALVNLICKWIPLEKKASFSSFIMSGTNVGIAVQFIISGYVADAWGWKGIFYLDGALGIVWTVFYIFVGSNSPEGSKIISENERSYIQNSLKHVLHKKKLKTPWKNIFISVPFWVLMCSCVGINWGFFTLLTLVPSYMSKILDVDIKSNGVLSALPYMTVAVLCMPFGYISDYILKKKWLTSITCRKLSMSIASFGPAIFLIGICYAPADITIFIVLLSIGVGLFAGFFTGDYLVYLDLSPNYASVLVSVSQVVTSLISLNAPLVTPLFVTDEENADQWHNVFFLSSGVFIITNIIFLLFGSNNRQPWDESSSEILDAAEENRKDKELGIN